MVELGYPGKLSTAAAFTPDAKSDGLSRWFDRCYRIWLAQHRYLIYAVTFLTWLPAILTLLCSLSLVRPGFPLARTIHGAAIYAQRVFPVLGMLLGIWIATLAAVSFTVTPEIRLTSPRRAIYSELRRRVRRVVARWMTLVMFIPGAAAHLLWYTQFMLVPRNLLPWYFAGATTAMESVIYVELTALALWGAVEVVQFVVLRSAGWRTSSQVLASMTVVLAFLSLWLNISFAGTFLPGKLLWIRSSLHYLLMPGVAIVLPLAFMLATRRPTRSMLEQL